MRGLPARQLLLILTLILLWRPDAYGRTETTLVGDEIPQRYYPGTNFIFDSSDSLYLNGRLLARQAEYTFDTRLGAFDLTRLNPTERDTLLIIYSAAPGWLKSTYGRPPEAPEPTATSPKAPPAPLDRLATRPGKSDISITGAKTFRFTARSAGASDFSQSLDLNVSGNLTPGLELSGTVSDRGYDPSYGTANSRLSEIDKLNLALRSKAFVARIGDISFDDRIPGVSEGKRVSGAAVDLNFPQAHFNAAAARPRGRFETSRFSGRDGVQGPYQVDQRTGTISIVPGSESVWLDGRALERGANKDYVMDYPTGRITFNVNHPVDNRSRIEVDYEPLLSTFKGELYASGGAVFLRDSTVNLAVQFVREGDDKDQPIAGELTTDELNILSAVGDATSGALRSGVKADTLGSYVLIADSLPDSVYQYVGEGSGDFSISFSFFGSGQGEYVFLGGAQYQYVGVGNGEYRPLVAIPAPERTDHYLTTLQLRDLFFTRVDAQLQQTAYDKNLLSVRDDGDNNGLYYSIGSVKEWGGGPQQSFFSLATRRKELRFRARQRIDDADFSRAYLLPSGFRQTTDEVKHDARARVAVYDALTFSSRFSRLDYQNSFVSDAADLGAQWQVSSSAEINAGVGAIRADLDSAAAGRSGTGKTYTVGLKQSVRPSLNLAVDYEHDSRENDYTGEKRGTRYHRVRTSIDRQSERLDYELFLEDSLSESWSQVLRRNRLSAGSDRKLGNLSYKTVVTYQWLARSNGEENSFLGRLNLDYDDISRRLGVGASYVVSDETRNSRGVTYLEVAGGEGDFVLEDGQYVPDPDGNYIRVEETLSEQASVRRGEKSFHFDKTWPLVMLRLNSNVREELLPGGNREPWWAIPFLSDRTQPYLYYSRRYHADFRIFPIRHGHAVNLSYFEDREIRNIAGVARPRNDFKGAAVFKQVFRRASFDQTVELFRNDRDDYFTGGGVVDGYVLSLGYRQLVEAHELAAAVGFRRADADANVRSETVTLNLNSRLQVVQKAQLRSQLELYHQSLTGFTDNLSYVLTDNRPGENGAVWSVTMRYGVREGMRINFSVSGKHADNRTARVTAKGEFVAGF